MLSMFVSCNACVAAIFYKRASCVMRGSYVIVSLMKTNLKD